MRIHRMQKLCERSEAMCWRNHVLVNDNRMLPDMQRIWRYGRQRMVHKLQNDRYRPQLKLPSSGSCSSNRKHELRWS